MKGNKRPLAALVLCHLAMILALVVSAPHLPERVASHFDASGTADGWISRSAHLWTIGGLAVGLSLAMLLLFYCLRFLPASGINLPNRDYWLAPERRRDTFAALFRAGIWLACLEVVLMLGLHLLLVDANAAKPPHMSDGVWLIGGGFLVAVGVWSVLLVRRFYRVTS